MKIVVSCGPTQIPVEILTEEEDAILTLSQFRNFIAEANELDQSTMKMLHRGRVLQGDDDTPLLGLNFKENDKVIVMGGRKMALKDDPGFAQLIQYEKHNLCNLQKSFDEISKDLTELEKNYLDEPKQRELAKRLDKRIKSFNEESERHLETIDGINIVRDDTPQQQAQRNREKRKGLIGGIQTLLNQNDAYSRRLEEYVKKLDGEIIE